MKQIHYIIRILLRGRNSTLTKIISLSLGLVVSILLFSQIIYEFNYEECYPEADHLALVRCKVTNMTTGEVMGDDGVNYDETVFAPTAAALAQDMPQEIESATCVNPFQNSNVYQENKLLKDVKYMFVDTCFFQTMGIPVLEGNPKELITYNTAFVSQHFARENFGDVNPVGKTLSLDKQREITIRGIYQDMPESSMLVHDLVISIHTGNGYESGNGWRGNDIFYSILRLRNVSDADEVNRSINRVIEKYTSLTWDNWKTDFEIISLPDHHLESSNVEKRLMIYAFLGFAVFFVAIMNYMLISIATLSRRAKTVGVHKCSGAENRSIFSMFMIETGIVVFASVALCVLIIVNARHWIEDLLSVRLSELFTWGTLWVPLLTILLLFLLAGVLPGRMFARIPVTQVFQRYTDGKKGWKRSLLFVQFAGVSFILGLLLVALLQYRLLMTQDMGISIPGLVEAESWMDTKVVENIRDGVGRQPMVEGVTVASHSVLGEYWTRGLMSNDGKRIATLNFNMCTSNYTDVMGIHIVEGTRLQKPHEVLVNEELVRLMKWTDGAVGKRLNDFEQAETIVGVFRDVRNGSFYSAQSPIALVCAELPNHTFNVRLKEPYAENLQRLNEFMEQIYPQVALQFSSVDSMVKNGYKDVYRFRNSIWITSAFILLIVFMGVIGYVSDETERRSKEIAIRKVNGAEVSDILRMLSAEIVYLSIPAILVGIGISYFFGGSWLAQFAEQIDLNLLLLGGLAILILVLILTCVLLKAWRIANENPMKSMKAE